MIANVGYLVDDAVYHPGDSFAVPAEPVQHAAAADQRAVVEDRPRSIDFAISVRAPRVHQIHDSLVTDVYANIVEGQIARDRRSARRRVQPPEADRAVTA